MGKMSFKEEALMLLKEHGPTNAEAVASLMETDTPRVTAVFVKAAKDGEITKVSRGVYSHEGDVMEEAYEETIEESEITPDIEFIIDAFDLDRDYVEFALSIRDKVRVTR